MSPDQQRELDLTTCLHWTGEFVGICRAGVAYDAVRILPQGVEDKWGPVARSPQVHPCIGCYNKVGATCEKYQEPSEKVLQEREAITKRLELAANAIRQHVAGLRGVRGQIVCPNCGGQLNYKVAAYNGHISGRCSTDRCVSFIE
jgi:hypothetical protein